MENVCVNDGFSVFSTHYLKFKIFKSPVVLNDKRSLSYGPNALTCVLVCLCVMHNMFINVVLERVVRVFGKIKLSCTAIFYENVHSSKALKYVELDGGR